MPGSRRRKRSAPWSPPWMRAGEPAKPKRPLHPTPPHPTPRRRRQMRPALPPPPRSPAIRPARSRKTGTRSPRRRRSICRRCAPALTTTSAISIFRATVSPCPSLPSSAFPRWRFPPAATPAVCTTIISLWQDTIIKRSSMCSSVSRRAIRSRSRTWTEMCLPIRCASLCPSRRTIPTR